jgi:hypothetical protein
MRRPRVADDPRDNVPDELEGRLDSLSATLTDDDIGTTTADPRGEVGDADDTDTVDADTDDSDADADDTDA